ncbi:MAG: bifunctional salicylyl-CoA 5-hydroxylase/oxidoreductase [Sandaracinaceae bacterium]|nr:bifunctional salicylyl-CoA 5-hydroxylase/oxidoreductase [Sandaracinaceae bacterium]
MRINVLGGGPAGLYLAILMKKADPSHRIEVFERNAPDDTFGWGVVFSDETLENLRDADPESFSAITHGFAYWDAIDVWYRGEVIRSGGHGFCGIRRQRLLQILQERAAHLGVEIHYHEEIDDLESLRDCDLLVAADGVNSRARERWAHSFAPDIDLRRCRYMWLGSTQRFEAFTFSFRENEHGVFQIHAYQFDPEHSTVIVECDEQSWLAAGLDRMTTEQSIAYCERLFAEELGGHPMLANRSRWIQFPTIKNGSWHHENVVLIGDAAHTAHFSIGSGTKLAMEDSIALAAALQRPGTMQERLQVYEDDRRPWVERTQRAAQQSLEWFENVRRHVKLPTWPFVISLLSRSRRVTHENLRMRDAGFVERADRWFMQSAGLEAVHTRPIVPPMFTPFSLRSTKLANRVVVSPMCQYSAVDGVPNDWHLVHLGSRAVGGAGLVFTEMTDVTADGRISPGCAGLWNEEQMRAYRRVVEFVHTNSDAKIGVQLAHAGRKGSTKRLWEGMDEPLDEGNWEVIGPSAIAYKDGMHVPRAMDRADMDRIRDAFVHATKLAIGAGFDVLEVHFAHGYLLSSFLTPLSNRRTDAYGGSLENRMRYPLEVFEAMRAVWPKDKPMSVRLSATDWVDGGFTPEDAVIVARALKERGCDVIDVSAGQTSPLAQPVYGRCFQTPFSEKIRNEAGIPTITVGNIPDADHVNTILLAGRADLCALARPHLRDPYFALHAAEAQGHFAMRWPNQYVTVQPRAPRS